MATPKILQISAVAVPGRERTFVNVYGLDDQSRVWQWNAKDAKWTPHKIEAKHPPEGF
jgi:hypothetical protein